MASTVITGATDWSAATGAGYLPVGVSADSTAYSMRLGAITGKANVSALSAAPSATDTTVTVYGLPDGVVANTFWVVIDPYTVQCEIRKVTGISTLDLTVAALTYDHAVDDAVMFTTNPFWSSLLFGAVFDGSTDDQAAHQAAITDAPAGASVDLSGPGTSRLASGLTVTDKSINLIQPRGGTLYQNYTGNLLTIKGTGSEEVTIKGLTQTSSTSTSWFVSAAAAESFKRLIIKDNSSQLGGISINASVSDLLHVSNNNIGDGTSTRPISLNPTSPNTASNIICNDNYVIGNVASGTTGLISIGGDDIQSVICCNNHVIDCLKNGFDLDSGSKRSVIIGNIAENCQGVGLDVKQGGANAENVTVVGNQMYECANGLSAKVSGVYADNVIIASADAPGGACLQMLPTGSFVTVVNNYIESAAAKIGIQHNGTARSVIRGNTIITPSNCIRVDVVVHLVIENNYCYQTDDATNNIHAPAAVQSNLIIRHHTLNGGSRCIRIDANWTNVEIYGNNYLAWGTSPILINAAVTAVTQRRITAFTNNDTTPSVIGGSLEGVFTCGNTGATTVTDYDNSLDGQLIEIHFTTGNTTITDGTNIMLSGSTNYTAPAGAILRLRQRGGVWYEISRIET
jgi:hypothetical protein